MLIMGVDPGLRHTGWGVIRFENKISKFVAAGVIEPKQKDELANRLAFLFVELTNVLHEFKPTVVAVEKVFVNKNPSSTLLLGMARGVVLAAPATLGMLVAEYSANSIKQTLTGAGHASKEQMGRALEALLPSLAQGLTSDAVDAVAVALCHAYTVRL